MFLAILVVGWLLPAFGHAAGPLTVEQAFQVSVTRAGEGRAALSWIIEPGHHLYRDQFQVRIQENASASTLILDLPAGTWRDDPDMGRTQVFSTSGHHEFALPSATHTVVLRYQGCADAGICYPPQERTINLDTAQVSAPSATLAIPGPLPPATPSAPDSGRGLSWTVLALAFLGGLILNILPCVLPVLAIKASAFLVPGHATSARTGLLAYSAGIVLSFLLLGGVLALVRPDNAGWGFQLQSPWFVGGLTLVFLLMGSALMGWWTLPAFGVGRVSGLVSRTGAWGDFLAGVLAVVVASPCVGPFLGTALAVAFLLPASQALVLFLAMGLGLAFPALVLALVPAARACLPRPGPWMERVRLLMGVPLFLAALWLAWVFSRLTSPGLALALLLPVIALLGTYRLRRTFKHKDRWSALAAPAALALVTILVLRPSETSPTQVTSHSSDLFTPTPALVVGPYGAQPFTPARLEQLRAQGRTVFVSIGADWCITCKANEATVLDRPEFSRTLASRNAVWLEGDWTRQDPEIAAFLRSRNAVGVPLYLVFRPDGVRQLPQILTQEEVARALL